jgi:hypothetical protein
MPTFSEPKFHRAQARYDAQDPPEDDLPTDEDIFDALWGEEKPQTRQEAAAAVASVRGGMAAIVRR